MKTRWILLISLLSLALGSCGGSSQTVVEDSPPPAPADINMVSLITPDATSTTDAGVTTIIATPTVIETSVWKNYQNTQIGYSAEYPADWTVNESAGINGELITTFMAPTDGQGIVVSILNDEAAVEEIPDMPNTRCQPVTISGYPGRRCFDTVAFSISTTFLGQGKQYAIAAFGKHPDQNIYQRFLESFTLTP
jgi:hypothetical protein